MLQGLDELALGHSVHIESVDNAVGGEVLNHLLLDVLVVVAVVNRARAAEKVDIVYAVLVSDNSALGVGEHLGKVSAV